MVSLNQINQEVDNKYGPFVVEDVPGGEVVLRNPIRLTSNERDQLMKLESELRAAQKASDTNAALAAGSELVEIVSVGDGGKRLLKELGDDPSKLMFVLELYSEAVQLGEAKRSES